MSVDGATGKRSRATRAHDGRELLATLTVGMQWPEVVRALESDQGFWARAKYVQLIATQLHHQQPVVTKVVAGEAEARCPSCKRYVRLKMSEHKLLSDGSLLTKRCDWSV